MIIYLCRHGQTTGDIEDRYGGDYEDHLTDLGKIQAEELARKLQNRRIQKIFTSSRIRAQETAKIISDILKVDVEIVHDLRERNHYGILTGLIKSHAKKEHPDLVEKLSNHRIAITGAEDYESFGQRVTAGLEKITARDLDTVCIISHGGPIRFIFREIINFGEIDISDCAYAKLIWEYKRLSVLDLNGITKK
ncbi:hypothetical protein A2397_04085 [Candidatus Amesbacteria bacterium RIFOXYB1_FULL_44_23]|uniref:Phosphoglycerate mutase n=1 Tax=Candidatus Amesbacteria bacterium RIFOXYB1_FULL_44_23 TaxID=1797263 RepID=A0A1F4ZR21_9BACT|nr:MAG: hypothetical protein A2397_04085 [Candidatus Amesbacteria bacterium RIFOXYB1_FULL_44_23]